MTSSSSSSPNRSVPSSSPGRASGSRWPPVYSSLQGTIQTDSTPKQALPLCAVSALWTHLPGFNGATASIEEEIEMPIVPCGSSP